MVAAGARCIPVNLSRDRLSRVIAPPSGPITCLNGGLYAVDARRLSDRFRDRGIARMPRDIICEDLWLTTVLCTMGASPHGPWLRKWRSAPSSKLMVPLLPAYALKPMLRPPAYPSDLSSTRVENTLDQSVDRRALGNDSRIHLKIPDRSGRFSSNACNSCSAHQLLKDAANAPRET